jgi:hypothetical protein
MSKHPHKKKAKIKYKLNRIAVLIDEARALLREEYPDGYIFFEAEGRIHAMIGKDDYTDMGSRQKSSLTYSNHCNYDCGAW